jgi:prepilin-type N-terminal cleavage/methylation domain-containing protein
MTRAFTTKRVSQKRNSDFSFTNERWERTRSSGFTLIEILITIALFAILMFGISQLYLVYGRAVTLQESSIGIALGGSSIVDAVRTAALQAGQVVATHTFSGVVYESATTTAIFELPAVDTSGAIITNTYDYIAISASGSNVYRIVDAASGSARLSGEKRLTGALGELSFTYDNASFPSVASIIVDATTTALVRGTTRQTHLREHIYLRNL